MLDVIGLLALLVVAAGCAWLTRRAWHMQPGFWRGAAVTLAGFLTLACIVALAFALLGYYRISARVNHPVAHMTAAGAPEPIARGQHLAHLCVACHSSTGDVPLDGGKDNLAAALGPPAGTVVAPNLTPGGHIDDMSDDILVRAIREGLDDDGRPLLLMPTGGFRNFSDPDVLAIVAYLRSQPKVEHDTPPVQLNVLGAILRGTGIVPTSVQTPIVEPVLAPRAGTPEYGKYLVAIGGCRDCHGDDLAGGRLQGVGPLAPNLTAHLKEEDESDFIKTIRMGVDHEGHAIDSKEDMPWKDYSGAFTDEDLKAMFDYLHALPTIENETPAPQQTR